MGRRLDGQRELEVARDGAAGGTREAQRLRLVQGLAVEGEARGQPHALVGPRRLGIPLVREVEPEDAEQRRGQAHARRALDVLRGGPAQQHGQVHLAALERGGAGGLVGQAAEDDPLDGRRLPPVAVEGLDDQLHARVEAHELVGPGADRRLAIAFLAHALEVLLRHHPARAGHERAVEGGEVRPRLLEHEPHAVRRRHLDLLTASFSTLAAPPGSARRRTSRPPR